MEGVLSKTAFINAGVIVATFNICCCGKLSLLLYPPLWDAIRVYTVDPSVIMSVDVVVEQLTCNVPPDTYVYDMRRAVPATLNIGTNPSIDPGSIVDGPYRVNWASILPPVTE